MALRQFTALIPFLTLIVVAFAILQVYTAITFAASRQFGFALFYAVFGFAGFALARALWTNRPRKKSGGS
jgi:hypothetical protein